MAEWHAPTKGTTGNSSNKTTKKSQEIEVELLYSLTANQNIRSLRITEKGISKGKKNVITVLYLERVVLYWIVVVRMCNANMLHGRDL